MRSTFSVSTWTWALAGCLACFLGCSQGEGDRCEIPADCSSGLTCSFTASGSSHDGICRPPSGSGAGGSPGQGSTSVTTGTSTDTSTSTSIDASAGQEAEASVAPTGGDLDAAAAEPDAALAD